MREIFYIIVPVFVVCTNIIYTFFCLRQKKSFFFTVFIYATVIGINAITDILILHFGLTETASKLILIRTFIYIPLIIWLFKGLLFQKLFAFLMQMTFMTIKLLLIGTLAQGFVPFNEDWYNTSYNENLYYISFLVIMIIVFTVYLLLVHRFGRILLEKLFAHGNNKEWVFYSIGAGVSWIILEITRGLFTYNLLIALSVLFFVLWSFIILCYALINTQEKTKQKYEADLAREIISSSRDHYQKMNEQYDAIRIMKHDYNFHLNAALDMLKRGDIQKSGEYLNGLKNQLADKEFPNFCENPVINSLVADYLRRCKELDIKMYISISIPDDFIILNYEMCIVLGNLLENAVEASQKLKANRKIELAVKPKGEQLAIMIRNTFDGNIVMDGEKFVSTKKDGGLGLQSVNAVILRYGDMFYTNIEDEWFNAYVLWRK